MARPASRDENNKPAAGASPVAGSRKSPSIPRKTGSRGTERPAAPAPIAMQIRAAAAKANHPRRAFRSETESRAAHKTHVTRHVRQMPQPVQIGLAGLLDPWHAATAPMIPIAAYDNRKTRVPDFRRPRNQNHQRGKSRRVDQIHAPVKKLRRTGKPRPSERRAEPAAGPPQSPRRTPARSA